MTRKPVIFTLIYLLALSAYISLSGAPLRVKVVDALSWLLILCGAACIWWSSRITLRRRVLLLLVVILAGALGYLYLVNRVVLKFEAFSAFVPFVRTYALYVLLVAFGAGGVLATTAILDANIRSLSAKGASVPTRTPASSDDSDENCHP